MIGFSLSGVVRNNWTLDFFSQACCNPHSQSREKLISHSDLALLSGHLVKGQLKTGADLSSHYLAKQDRLQIYWGQNPCFTNAVA